jgi:hypoxanthine phosphoribosyltransferase
VINLSWPDVQDHVRELCKRIPYSTPALYGVPTGGCFVALLVSEVLFLPMLEAPLPGTLVLDDLVDSGATMARYAEFPRDALFRKPHSPKELCPQASEVADWIKFPWEHDPSAEDEVTRLIQIENDVELLSGWLKHPARPELIKSLLAFLRCEVA